MKITGLPAGYDNYIWVLEAGKNNLTSSDAWIVDPGESHRVINYFQKNNLKLAGILLTHHHYDHTDGVEKVLAVLGNAPIISNSRGPYKNVTNHVEEGDVVDVLGEKFEVLNTPGHSHEHIIFYNPKYLFSGDALFTAGCGKAWCQSSQRMADSLLKIRQLNDDCLVYCGHEYTYGNINFAAIAEPNNQAIKQRQQEVKEKTKAGIPCVPERLSVEKQTNPFLRFDTETLKQGILNQATVYENFKMQDSGNLYANLRAWKDKLDQTGELEKGLN